MLAGLDRAELATERHEVIMAGAKAVDVCRVRITARRVNKTGSGDDDPTLIEEVAA